MSQLVLDDQLDVLKVLPCLRRWASVLRLQELRPGKHILDDRVPEILLTCHEPTFVTIDPDFWKPKLLRQFFRHVRFRSHAQRMGKVIRLTHVGVSYWEIGATTVQHALFGPAPKKRRRKT